MTTSHQEFAKRFTQAIDAKKLDWVAISDKTKINYEMIRRYANGLAKPREDKMQQLAEVLGVSTAWLSYGEGKKRITYRPRDGQPISEVEVRAVEFWEGHTPLDDDEFEVPYYKDVELLGGDGRLPAPDDGRRRIKYGITAAYASGANPDSVICLTLKGDSMEELIPSGSMIAVDQSKKEIREGQIYAFNHGELLRVKYLLKRPNGDLVLRSHNPKYEDEIVTGEELNTIEIIGWVWNWSVLKRW
ncbi:XRE family transcriptional regulator [Moraxella sp. ZJ142]|uniref:XRE family transcriptional regulator n=1 Tax=Moraxella marmotae TaxID=3344520 RepID=UPI0035D4EFF6